MQFLGTLRVKTDQIRKSAWPRGYKFFPCSTQLSTKFILLINVKMPTIVGILTFISMINATSERLLHLSVAVEICMKKFITAGPDLDQTIDTLMVFLKEFFKVFLKNNLEYNMKIIQHAKSQ